MILAMLEYGKNDWYKPKKTSELAKYYLDFHIDNNDKIRELCFNDKDKQHFVIGKYDKKVERDICRNLRNSPMSKWRDKTGKVDTYEFGYYNKDEDTFEIRYLEQVNNKKKLFDKTKEACKSKIIEITGIRSIDFNIDHTLDFEIIQKEIMEAPLYRENIVKSRVGQGKWRNRLIKEQSECVLCKIQNPKLLIASHIKPWRHCDSRTNEHLDLDNGLMLCSIHDKLFDQGFITFNEDGFIDFADAIDEYKDDKAIVSHKIAAKINIKGKTINYMRHHRTVVFIDNHKYRNEKEL